MYVNQKWWKNFNEKIFAMTLCGKKKRSVLQEYSLPQHIGIWPRKSIKGSTASAYFGTVTSNTTCRMLQSKHIILFQLSAINLTAKVFISVKYREHLRHLRGAFSPREPLVCCNSVKYSLIVYWKSMGQAVLSCLLDWTPKAEISESELRMLNGLDKLGVDRSSERGQKGDYICVHWVKCQGKDKNNFAIAPIMQMPQSTLPETENKPDRFVTWIWKWKVVQNRSNSFRAWLVLVQSLYKLFVLVQIVKTMACRSSNHLSVQSFQIV